MSLIKIFRNIKKKIYRYIIKCLNSKEFLEE